MIDCDGRLSFANTYTIGLVIPVYVGTLRCTLANI